MNHERNWVKAHRRGQLRRITVSAALLLAALLLAPLAPQAAAAPLTTQLPLVSPPAPGPAAPGVTAPCAYLLPIVDWYATFSLSWVDSAAGTLFDEQTSARLMRHATVHAHLTSFGGDDVSVRWATYAPGGQAATGSFQVDDVMERIEPLGLHTFTAIGAGSPNNDNANGAILDIYSNCTYALDFGIAGDVTVEGASATPFQEGLGLGDAHLAAQVIPQPLPGLDLHGTLSMLDDPGATTGTYFFAGFDDGLNGVIGLRGGESHVARATVSWSLVPGHLPPCAQHLGTIDASDPTLDDPVVALDVDPPTIPPNQGDSLNPPDPANLTVKVTCDGVPVKNAQVQLEVTPKANSGGHLHSNGANPRPRGYLKAPGAANYTELTEAKKSLTVQTDGTGRAVVPFLPGTDIATGGGGACAGKQRGIAGTYQVRASLVDARFQGRQAEGAIEVKRTDFVPLPLPGFHYLQAYHSGLHPQGTWGTQATIGGLEALAARFYDYQIQHNQVLTQAGKAAWPIMNLQIIDMSLKDGGLFDTGGTNVCAGGGQAGFVPWRLPHQTHLNGTGFDLSTNAGVWPGSEAQRDWWKGALRGLGCFYGTWAAEVTLHLEVDQTSSNWDQLHPGCEFALPPGSADQAASASAPAAGPTLFVSAWPATVFEDSFGQAISAPGQPLSFTVGVNNLASAGDAHQVVLTATLPAGLQFVSANPPATRMGGANQPIWDIGVLTAPVSLQMFNVTAQVGVGVTLGTLLTVTAQATTSDSGPTPLDHFSAGWLVQPLGPDLALQDQGLEGAALTVDQPVTATVSVVNLGTAIAPNTLLTLTLPTSVTVTSASPVTATAAAHRVTWNLGSVAPGASKPVTVTLQLDPALSTGIAADPDFEAGQPLTFTLAAATASDIQLSNNVQTVVKSPVLSGNDAAVAFATHAGAGQDITYTLPYGNYGNQLAPGVWVTATLGAPLSLVSAVPTPTAILSGTVVGWNLGVLPVGAEGALRIRARLSNLTYAPILVYATITSGGFDIAPTNNFAVDIWQASKPGPVATLFLPLLMR